MRMHGKIAGFCGGSWGKHVICFRQLPRYFRPLLALFLSHVSRTCRIHYRSSGNRIVLHCGHLTLIMTTHNQSTNQNNLAAVVETPGARLTTVSRPVPTPGPDELVIRNYAIAANPVDWKIQEYQLAIKTYPTVLGSDACGIVTSLGADVKKFRVGQRVCGFAAVIYNDDINHGAWQTYTILREIATTKIPDSMTYEEGSVFPMAMATSAIALFVDLKIPRPTGPPTVQASGLLIWGASSSVGVSALQLGRNLGFKVCRFCEHAPREFQHILSSRSSLK